MGAPAVPPPVLADYVAGAFLGLLRWWLELQRPYSLEQMHRIFRQMVLAGVRAGMRPGEAGRNHAVSVSARVSPQTTDP